MKEIFLYNLDNEKGRRIRQLCALLKIRMRPIVREDYLEPIGAITGVKGMERKGIPFDGQAFTDEMILFKDFDDKTLGEFLEHYRLAGIGKVNLKAGLTPYNITWNSFQLHDELTREHEELTRQR